jgi:bifunctional non-homologous end joining protein LigD
LHISRDGTVQPIRPTGRKQPFDGPDWLFDVKYDGFRGLCYVEQGRGCFISRNGNVLSRCDALGDQVAAALDVDEAVIDGEVIAADETGRPQYYDLLRGTSSPCYIAFDLVWLNGADLRPLPLYERRRALQSMLPKGSKILSEALSVEGRGRELVDLMCAHDLEGVVAKRELDPKVSFAAHQTAAPHAVAAPPELDVLILFKRRGFLADGIAVA